MCLQVNKNLNTKNHHHPEEKKLQSMRQSGGKMVSDQFAPEEGLELNQWEKISKTQLMEWSMVSIRDSTCSIFPPTNHENLHLPTSPSFSSSSSHSLSSFSPSYSDESGPVSPNKDATRVGSCGGVRRWVGFIVGLVRAKVLGIGSLIRWEKVLCFASGASIVAVVFMVWSVYMRLRQRRYRMRCDLMMREKDERINKLLHQIAQMNQVLVARHRVLASKLAD